MGGGKTTHEYCLPLSDHTTSIFFPSKVTLSTLKPNQTKPKQKPKTKTELTPGQQRHSHFEHPAKSLPYASGDISSTVTASTSQDPL